MIVRTSDVERELETSLALLADLEREVSKGIADLLMIGWTDVDIVSAVDRARRHLVRHGRRPGGERGGDG